MVDIQSKEVIDKISEELKIQPSLIIPKTLAKDIQLVYAVNPQYEIKITSGTLSDGTSATLFTTSTTKDTYLTSAALSIAKSALATSLFSTFSVEPRGKAGGTAAEHNLLMIRYEPTTAASNLNITQTFPPILLQRGSPINITNSTAVGSIDTFGSFTFYEVDPL